MSQTRFIMTVVAFWVGFHGGQLTLILLGYL